MASVGFDNSVRLWDLTSISVTNVFEDKGAKTESEGQINSLSWHPDTKDEVVCIGTVTGLLKVIDLKKNRVLVISEVSNQAIFEVDWNSNGIVACSENGSV